MSSAWSLDWQVCCYTMASLGLESSYRVLLESMVRKSWVVLFPGTLGLWPRELGAVHRLLQGPQPKSSPLSLSLFFFFFFLLFRATPVAYVSSQARAESELQLLAYATATEMPDLSHVCNPHCSSWQCQILNPLSRARDGTHIVMDTSRVHFC